jgi:hypothetical protein
VKNVIVAETKTIAADLDNARTTRLDHLDLRARSEAHFLKTVHMLHLAEQLTNLAPLTAGQKLKWHKVFQVETPVGTDKPSP